MHTTEVYRELRERITELLRSAPAEMIEARVPGCPEWTPRQLAAHLSGVVADALAGNLADAGQDHWTAAQVAAREHLSLDEVLAEWNRQAPELEGFLGPDGAPDQLVYDTLTHEQDLRVLLGTPLVDPDAVTVAMRFVADNLPAATAEKALPELRIEPTDGGPAVTIGSGEPAGTLRATGFDLLRSFSGRRSAEQIAALDWSGDPAVWLPAFTFGPFRVPPEPVEPGPAAIPGG